MKALINLNNEQKMSSREIASLTGKEHRNILRDCDTLNEHYENLALLKIEQGYYTLPNTGSQKHREYLLTKMQCFDLLTGYRTDLRIKVNRRWAELEEQAQQVTLPTTYKEALLELIKKEEEKEVLLLQNQEQQAQLEAQAPKVLFTEAVMGSKTSCLIGELAKVITQNGYEIGERRLFKYLRENGYLGRKGERYNIPNQKYVEQGIFELKKGTRSGSGGVMHTTITTKVTGKGQVYFVNKFLKHLQSA
ncbi:phage regulatory protein/antirepressor Ant [Riemerella anatipestifer]|uniref:phage regulatory protein/antirepressor Ant n=1 Tax=Riemerella anatipestifer TaxID=34085 RepID=UPI001BDAAFF9|nr:phage regulatory protein/antirepressor Ant [Riemerella anatipestifer]MBT0540039.1 phage regulatory protein/antirepressor Ant [Riemerella anatipestifer]MBT0543900.1 phage regulatory protein/antirepressor Ant [Riemerella anatipestifer]MBT0545867.1 phage regulatory protein/antirepressor Ant [Riemerella anatipestifer]MBT0547803.1 phage regulatory protein/antirepressor Ant [Riemerella anatipestifer]MBT0552238.1 phage regulatory protein/antirepressor Ant [Riemerella anatipestifer]